MCDIKKDKSTFQSGKEKVSVGVKEIETAMRESAKEGLESIRNILLSEKSKLTRKLEGAAGETRKVLEKELSQINKRLSDIKRANKFPLVDMYASEKELVIIIDLPDVRKETLSVTAGNTMLEIKGEARTYLLEDKKKVASERYTGPFKRVLSLPAHVEKEKVSASLKDGVLTVLLPRTTESFDDMLRVDIE